MKKNGIFLYVILIMLSATIVTAQPGNVFTINAGYMNPKNIKGGMFFGFMFGTAIDEAVDIGIGADIFHKSYSERTNVANEEKEGLTTNTYETEVEYTRTMVPLTLAVNVKIPTSAYYGYFIRGSLNYELLFSKEKNYELDKSQTQRYGGFGWQAAAGLFYHVGSRSTLIADVGYNSCEVGRDVDSSKKGLPTTERVNLSGFGYRLGVSLDLK